MDNLKFSNRLKEAGVPSAQAEAEAEILSEISAVNLQELATKEELPREIKDLHEDMPLKFERTPATRRDEISANKFSLLKWFIGILIAQVSLIIGILKFLPGNI